MTNELVWVLSDDRAGNANQAMGLADALNMEYVKKDIRYNFFMRLPNFILGSSLFAIDQSTSSPLDPPYPNLIISAGRKTAPVALYLKKHNPGAKLIHVMRPTYGDEKFDLIVLPEHDKINYNPSNIYRTVGAINNVNEDLIAKNVEEFYHFYPQDNLAVIGVFIGGDSKHYKFSLKDAKDFACNIDRIANNHGAKLYISFSRRTSDDMKNIFYNHFNESHVIYDPELGGFNPYIALLGVANFIITTSDSISMSSEVATSGKPLYIYVPKNFTSNKHLKFTQNLVDSKIARIFDENVDLLEEYFYEKLKEASKVATYIKENILPKKLI